jgi:cytochrome c oxidase subunit 2
VKIFLAILFALASMQELTAPPQVVEVSAKRFEFTPKEIHLRAGQPVTIRLSATDRPHGLLINALGVDLDADVDHPDSVTITPEKPGTYPAICDHYCGSGHGNMKMTIVVE